jgi:hypothetical protein
MKKNIIFLFFIVMLVLFFSCEYGYKDVVSCEIWFKDESKTKIKNCKIKYIWCFDGGNNIFIETKKSKQKYYESTIKQIIINYK